MTDSFVMRGDFAITSPQSSKLVIRNHDGTDMVTFDLATGDMTFGPNYRPEAAARLFWAAMVGEYRDYLEWKAEREIDGGQPHAYVSSTSAYMGDCAVCGHPPNSPIHRAHDAAAGEDER